MKYKLKKQDIFMINDNRIIRIINKFLCDTTYGGFFFLYYRYIPNFQLVNFWIQNFI